jgi:hypothetical protein
VTITRRAWDAARAARKAVDGHKLSPHQVAPNPKTAAYGAACDARQRIGGSVSTIGSKAARSLASRRKVPVTLPRLSILGE